MEYCELVYIAIKSKVPSYINVLRGYPSLIIIEYHSQLICYITVTEGDVEVIKSPDIPKTSFPVVYQLLRELGFDCE